MRKRAAVADLRATLCGFGFVTWKAGPTARTGLRPQEAVSDRKKLFPTANRFSRKSLKNNGIDRTERTERKIAR
ncbi:hypothetical protein [Reyranella sp.]|uniref:hypothetical protein n=1 Tax=Reyranella sp. TaxID=1929291 RepID=UPI003784FD6F